LHKNAKPKNWLMQVKGLKHCKYLNAMNGIFGDPCEKRIITKEHIVMHMHLASCFIIL